MTDTLAHLLADVEQREADAPRRRILAGIVAPYGIVADGPHGPERYAPGVFTRGRRDSDPPIVLVDEGHGSTIGVLVRTEERANGLYAEFALPMSGRAAEVVELAEMGALWAFSAGWAPIPGGNHRENGVLVHTMGDLRHVGITASPVHENAKLLAVRERPPHMPDETPPTGPPETPPAGPPWSASVAELRDEIAAIMRQNAMLEALVTSVERSPVPVSELRAIRTAGQYLHTVAAIRYGGPTERRAAEELLEQATKEIPELRNTTAAFPGMVPEVFMGPVIDRVLRGSPLLNAAIAAGMAFDLPETGMNIHRPRMSTGNVVAWEAAEGDTPATQTMASVDVIGAIKALKGRQRLTLQAALRTGPSATDAMLRDLAGSLQAGFNEGIYTGAGVLTSSLGAPAGIIGMAGVSTVAIATWTAITLTTTVTAAEEAVWAATNQAPLFWVMHSRRWARIKRLLDTSNRPLVDVGVGGVSAGSIASDRGISGGSPLGGPGQPVASLGGYPVVIDNATPTNLGGGTEDRMLLVGPDAFEVFHEPRRQLQFQSPDDFQTSYGMAKLGAVLPTRPAALVVCSGAGLVP